MAASSGNQVLGQYTIYEQLGRGGMATVNRAEMRGLAGFRKPVALKRLLPDVAKDPSMVQSFVHEARLASHLHHPNIAQTYDLGRAGDTYFIAMEYIPGPTLAQLLRRSAAAGPAPIPIALSILGQICDALDYAHNLCDEHGTPLGIVHRDVSPSNIIISSTGVVKLIDFGIAKAARRDRHKTDPGMIKGKLSYLAPEYLLGKLDLRADLFSLGAIAHELLTGRRLFHAQNDFETILQLRELPIQPPSRWNPDIPPDLDDIVLTALQRSPELRWQNAAAMRTAITNVLMSLGAPVTNLQVLEWVESVFRRESSKESGRGRGLDPLDGPSHVARGSGVELALGSWRAGARRRGATQDRTRLEKVARMTTAELLDPAAPVDEPAPAAPAGPTTERVARAAPPATTEKLARVTSRPMAPRPHGARRGWLVLLLLLLILAAVARDELAVAGHDLYAWYTG